MERDVRADLLDWREGAARKPLLLKGARQVGKTWLLQDFAAKEYESCLYLNFEKDPRIGELFEGSLEPSVLLKNLSLYLGKPVDPENSLVILDEIQVSNAALNSLKYFSEEMPHAHIAAAGSLLGVKLSKSRSFPVGKVTLVDLHPMNFLEFLDAVSEGSLRELIENKEDLSPIPVPIHEKLVDLLRDYYFVGGMPEVIAAYAERRDPVEVREIQEDILEGYQLDFAKYAPSSDFPKIMRIWESIPAHLSRENKKFQYSTIRQGGRAREYEAGLAWLVHAGLLHKSLRVSTPKLPLRTYADPRAFKTYVLDVGLLCAMARLDPRVLIEGERIFVEFHGALVENYVSQQLITKGDRLHYWATDTGGQAEVDFLIEQGVSIYPLEVKAGISLKSKSLASYGAKYGPRALCRSNLKNFDARGAYENYPLYAVSRVAELGSA